MTDYHKLQGCQTCRMQEHLLMHRLSPELRLELAALCLRVSIPAGSTIFNEGDEPTGILILRTGLAKVTMTSEVGRTVVLYIAAPGELLGLSSVISGTKRQVTAQTIEPCELDMIRRDAFLNFLENHDDQFRAALDELAVQHACILDAIRRLSLAPSLLASIARFLLGLNCPEKGPQTDKLRLRLTHEEIAQQLGTTRESVTRTLSRLRKNNIIAQHGQTITIVDRGTLEHLATARAEEASLTLA